VRAVPRFGHRSAPLDSLNLDLATVRELARALAERLDAVGAFGSCPTCREAEARAFLARLRRVLEDPGAREV
jgi:hypothetical protein